MANVLSKTQYEYLAESLASQYVVFQSAATEASASLDYVVLLDELFPTMDLINPFYTHYLSMQNSRIGDFRTAVSALQNHVITRSGTDLNTYLGNNAILVSQDFANLSSGLGYPIDPSHIIP